MAASDDRAGGGEREVNSPEQCKENAATTLSVFYAVDNWRAKLQLVDAAFDAQFIHMPGSELVAEWSRLSDKLNKLARKRNKLAHWFVKPAQRTGTGAEHEPIAPARLCPPYGSPNWYRETGLNSFGQSLTVTQVRHIELAFNLLAAKLREFNRKVADESGLSDRHVRRAFDLLLSDTQLDPTLLAALRLAQPSPK